MFFDVEVERRKDLEFFVWFGGFEGLFGGLVC